MTTDDAVERISLYRPPTYDGAPPVDADEVADWLRERVDADVAVRDRFLDEHRTDDLPEAFAEARVLDPHDPDTGNTMLGIVRYEERALDHPEREGGVLYDGLAVQRALNAALPQAERSLDHVHVALLDRALGTWGDHDARWHKRVNVLGQPALVSVPGLYEAPAKPERYYKEKQKHAMFAGDAPPREVLENQVEGEFLVENDPRTTAALKGYVLQAVHLAATGEGFCDDERCRLSNPHRQEGVVKAQLREPEFCTRHAELYEAGRVQS
ncbi:hypothetical protein G9464_08055 [Halostella sp. JP-L12]|uniref:DUF7001 family protein n=1 Tax=Halostella TaxID=1843185 RepID=UPI000EF80D9B|nr:MULTISPECIES: DUF6775 family putative metallopeptidase [Halostella]NHN47548.1 hypothetical protein [Halostella sp. JP-L12]